jgi:hypothetical protein
MIDLQQQVMYNPSGGDGGGGGGDGGGAGGFGGGSSGGSDDSSRNTTTFLNFTSSVKLYNERHGRMVNTPASYLGGPRFKYWLRDQLSTLRFICGFPHSFHANAGIVP